MRRFILLCLLMFTVSSVVFAQRMTDEQVIQYVQEAQQAGKSQQQMSIELMKRGVTKEQIQRIQSEYSGKANVTTGTGGEKAADSRLRTPKKYENKNKNISQENSTLENSNSKKQTIKGLRAKNDQQRDEKEMEQEFGWDGNEQTDYLEYDNFLGKEKKEKKGDPTQQIFGHNIFDNENLTFEPNINVATPNNYCLGAGDEVIIDVWGVSQKTIREIISPEGTVQIENLGPVYLSGKTVKEANNYLKNEFAKIYAGVTGETPNTQIKLTLGEIRSIQVNVMGEVVVPGTYTLSSFASVFHALYWAGGVNKIGSLRSIKVIRDGETVADVDIYDFIMEGRLKDDIRLQDGDVILVNPYQTLVQILGKVKRPMYYEMKPTETIATLLKYAGGFTGDAYKKAIRLVRKSGREHQIFNIDEMDYSVFRVEDGDVLTVDSVLDRFENRVEVRGAVYREGLYQLSGEVNTVKQLIKKAEGVRGDAFLNRAVISREYDDLTREMIAIDLKGLLNGVVADIPLQKNDILFIPSVQDLREETTVAIHGEVADPGTYLYADKMTVEDLILQAGGLLEAAATTRVEVSRRVKDPKSTVFSGTIGQNFSFDLKDGLLVGEGSGSFHLEPFDEVYIRKSPAYHRQQTVTVAGEVLFSGNYALSKKNERLSDLITKAGGISSDAYAKGARLLRKMSEEELRRKEDVLRMAQMTSGGDSISVKKLDLSDTYSVGINLEKALQNPGSDYDMVLREGDMLYVPEYVSTVKISGAVMYPNTVLYKAGEGWKYYVNQAGGFGNDARKRRAYVVHMNGTVSRLKSGGAKEIEPGCEIIVPSKDPKKKMSPAEIIGMGTSAASLATMIATLVNLFK
ncbi:SLBB domain-containing protein [Bacteroides eggerthii]|uniref:SLBB domain-containing protein n=1 Tax=Bacteroides eggerthii TaxID=28111 RepID=UPI00189ED4D6|nr:SLBB domain-containing protein [Bacteroides eggerthii]